MTLIVTSEFELNRVVAPRLPTAPTEYEKRYHDQFADVLRLYFNRLDNILGQLVASMETIPVSIGGTNVDAFGRLRVSNPFTLFDSQNRYQKDNQFAESTATGGTVTYTLAESTVNLNVTTTSGSETVRQSYRVMPYQPGKGLLVLATFVMADAQTNLRQRVGYFNTDNGVFFQKDGATNAFVLRTATSGSPSDARTVTQANWNGDKLDGTGASGFTLDTSKSQILWMDFEWLGVGSVRCGFIINGQYIVCHTFNNANDQTKVYMTTAILPVRYEIKANDTLASSATLKQICSTVITEGGYQQAVASQFARTTSIVTGFGTTFVPMVSIRLASDSLGAVVLPQGFQVLPTVNQEYEIALFKNATLTGASYNTTTFNHVDFDVTATAMSGGTMVLQSYVSSSTQGRSIAITPAGYNFDLQLGVDLSGVSDVYTLAVRTLDATPTGDAFGVIDFIDLTD
jgi:hypothetical protein